jgi:hypothetical protein
VAEDGKDPREIAVKLNLTLDQNTETTIYHREGEPESYYYVKERTATLPEKDVVNANFTAFNQGPVGNLQSAFVYVDRYGEGGTNHNGYEYGTTVGYSEYRLFVKKKQELGKMCFRIINSSDDTRDNMSIEFYGAGQAGQREQKITRNDTYLTGGSVLVFNHDVDMDSLGFISLMNKAQQQKRYKALVLGKNITIDAGGVSPTGSLIEDHKLSGTNSTVWGTRSVRSVVAVNEQAMLIMNVHSKVTGAYAPDSDVSCNAIFLEKSKGKAYINGGLVATNRVVRLMQGTKTNLFINGETYNSSIHDQQFINNDNKTAGGSTLSYNVFYNEG